LLGNIQGDSGNSQHLSIQPGPSGFTLVSHSPSNMVGTQGGFPLWLLEVSHEGGSSNKDNDISTSSTLYAENMVTKRS
jgi:hypothetical protein